MNEKRKEYLLETAEEWKQFVLKIQGGRNVALPIIDSSLPLEIIEARIFVGSKSLVVIAKNLLEDYRVFLANVNTSFSFLKLTFSRMNTKRCISSLEDFLDEWEISKDLEVLYGVKGFEKKVGKNRAKGIKISDLGHFNSLLDNLRVWILYKKFDIESLEREFVHLTTRLRKVIYD